MNFLYQNDLSIYKITTKETQNLTLKPSNIGKKTNLLNGREIS